MRERCSTWGKEGWHGGSEQMDFKGVRKIGKIGCNFIQERKSRTGRW